AVALMFLICLRLTTRLWIALVTTGAFAFVTQGWATAIRTIWMHTPALGRLTLALLLALHVRRSGAWCYALGSVLALAYFVRPTNAIPLLALAVWVSFVGRRPILRFVRGAATVTCVFVVCNLVLYGKLLQPY